MRVALVLNPAARSGRTGALADAVLAAATAAGLDATLYPTARPRDAVRIAHLLATSGSVEAIVAVGGDGTVHEVAEGLLAAQADGAPRVPFGVVPLGTGNDYVKVLRAPRRWQEAVAALAQATPRPLDAIALRWRTEAGGTWHAATCANTLGVGLDARVAVEAPRFKRLGGALGYLVAVWAALRGWRSPHARVTLSGAVEGDAEGGDEAAPFFEGPFFLCTVGNGTCSGGGFYLTPGAIPDDGWLDVCTVADQPLRRIPLLLALAMRGRHGRAAGVRMARARHVRVTLGTPCAIHADGEVVTAGAVEVEAWVMPSALRVLG